MHIAFCIDRIGLLGLGATLSSLIRNCSDTKRLKLWFLCAYLNGREKSKIDLLLKVEKFDGAKQFVDFDPKEHFQSLNSLHGDWTTYGRLLLAEIITADKVLYLDSDLIVEVDVLELEHFDCEEYSLAAVGGGRFQYALGSRFYLNTIGLSPDVEYFNAGVLLLNLKQWRKNHIKEKCLQIASQYPKELPSHDQSLLNIFCAGSFGKLPSAFNCAWLAYQQKPAIADKMILHFVGSPKPWDPLGAIIHNGFYKWKEYSDTSWNPLAEGFALTNYKRVWKIRRSYIRCIRNRFKAVNQ